MGHLLVRTAQGPWTINISTGWHELTLGSLCPKPSHLSSKKMRGLLWVVRSGEGTRSRCRQLSLRIVCEMRLAKVKKKNRSGIIFRRKGNPHQTELRVLCGVPLSVLQVTAVQAVQAAVLAGSDNRLMRAAGVGLRVQCVVCVLN